MAKFSKPHIAVAWAALLLLGAAGEAQSPLTTTFAGGNWATPGSAVFFDLQTGGSGLSIHALDIHDRALAGTPAGLTVYLRLGPHTGFETLAAEWQRVARDDGSALSAGFGVATHVPLLAPICLPANQLFGVAVVGSATTDQEYTNGTGINQVHVVPELRLSAGSAQTSPFATTPIVPRVFNGAVHFHPAPGCNLVFPAGLSGVAESVLHSGTADRAEQPRPFEDGWILRWNAVDLTGTTAGNPAIILANLSLGQSAPRGLTPFLLGFEQLWSGSNPSGFATNVPPGIIGGAEVVLSVPHGLLNPGDTLRLQGLMFDAAIGGRFPVLPTNSIEFVHRDPVNIEVRCTGANSFNADTGSGFFTVDHLPNSVLPPIESLTLDWVQSSNPFQSTMRFDTDQSGMADVFEGGNGSLVGTCGGTYRNMSDSNTGLVFDGTNTVPATPCDPAANTGWRGSNPGGVAGDWRSLGFRFAGFAFASGRRFEFDCDTDGGLGTSGDDMAGMVVTIGFVGGTSVTLEVAPMGPGLGLVQF